MSSSCLSTLQIAVLQEMGLTVWSKQSVVSEDNNANDHHESNASQTTPKNNLKHLRSIVSSNEGPQSVEKPFSSDAVTRCGQWIIDVEQAMSEFTQDDGKITWLLGDTVKVTSTSVCLPALPTELTTTLKKQLWQKIQQLSSDR